MDGKDARTPAGYSALDALSQKQATRAYRIIPTSEVVGTGDDAALVITIPINALAQAKPATGQRKGLGFALGPVPFDLPNGHFQLYAGWVALTNR